MAHAPITARLVELVHEAREAEPLSERKREMLQAALRIVTQGGFEALSLRRVGLEVGVKLPSVQHHFGTKDGLVAALVNWALEWYSSELLRLLGEHDDDPERAFRRVVDYFVTDLGRRSGAEPHLWAYSMHDEHARKHRARYLLIYREFVYDLLTRLGTIDSEPTRWHRAAQICALIEGMYLLTGDAVPDDLAGYEAELQSTICSLAGVGPA